VKVKNRSKTHEVIGMFLSVYRINIFYSNRNNCLRQETYELNIGDPNMDTVFKWSKDFAGPASLPPHIEKDHAKLVEIVQAVGNCVGYEFDEDGKVFERKYGRSPYPDELPYIHPAFMSYDNERKNRFINCIKEKTRTLLCIVSKLCIV
jgi:hypothetical protein